MNKSMKMLLALLAVFALFAAACGDDDSGTDAGDAGGDDAADDSGDAADDSGDAADDSGDDADDSGDAADDSGDDAADDTLDIASIGAGVDVTMARANWSSGYIQAEIYNQILTRMGYNVASPSLLELAPSAAYLAMAEGDFDFWTNSWYPGHFSWHEAELPDGTLVGDYLNVIGGLFLGSGVQGFLITKSVADEHGITSMQQINDDPELIAVFDEDGNGKADIFGCEESWTCDNIITSQIAFYGWENIEQTIAGYDAMFAEMTARVAAGEPGIIYTWTPSAYVVDLVPGDTVMWLSMHPTDVIDESNPTGIEGGEFHTQEAGFSGFGDDVCTQPCQLGWKPADITVTANQAFLDANPVLNALFPLLRPSVIDISIAQVEQSAGDGTEDEVVRIAGEWVDANWDQITAWIEEAAAAAG